MPERQIDLNGTGNGVPDAQSGFAPGDASHRNQP